MFCSRLKLCHRSHPIASSWAVLVKRQTYRLAADIISRGMISRAPAFLPAPELEAPLPAVLVQQGVDAQVLLPGPCPCQTVASSALRLASERLGVIGHFRARRRCQRGGGCLGPRCGRRGAARSRLQRGRRPHGRRYLALLLLRDLAWRGAERRARTRLAQFLAGGRLLSLGGVLLGAGHWPGPA